MRHVMCGLGEKMTTAEINILIDGMEDMNGLVRYFFITRVSLPKLRQVSGIKYIKQMSTYHLVCGDSEIS